MEIRTAVPTDLEALYTLGLETPEFKVSASAVFMERDEFLSAIRNPHGTFLLAESEGKAVGFIYANRQDIERAPDASWACLVYVVVTSGHRKQGIAQALYAECIARLKHAGVCRVYGWANAESDGSIIQFLKKNGFEEGHRYVWMDKEL